MKILIFPKFNRGEGDNKSVIVITQGGGGCHVHFICEISLSLILTELYYPRRALLLLPLNKMHTNTLTEGD